MEAAEFFMESQYPESCALQETFVYDDLWHRRLYGPYACRIRIKRFYFAIVDIQYGEIQLYDGNIILSDDATEEEKSNIITTLEKDSKMAGSTEGILSQITVGNGEEWHDVYLDVPKKCRRVF